MAEVLIIGGGVSGLGAALGLSRDGHSVTVLDRDATEVPPDPDSAFDWDRRGAPQVRHSHAFLARLRLLLAEHHPDVLDALLAAGATEMRFGAALPPTLHGYVPQPDDHELTMLGCRRTTFEWVLRRTVEDEGRVRFRPGVAVDGLIADPGSPPVVRGVRLAGGGTVHADVVVVAGGRRSALPEWLAEVGCDPVAEEVDDTGIVYLSRFYRLRDGADLPDRTGPAGADLGYLKYGAFVGDRRTFSLTFAVPTDDDHLRRVLDEPEVFDAVCGLLAPTAAYVDGRGVPISPVHKMAGLVNRWREFVPAGNPVVLGLHAIGDTRLCTNPLYGRGCSTGFWHGHLLREVVRAHPGDLRDQAVALAAATEEHLVPWYRSSVVQDAEARRVAAALLAGQDPDGDTTDPRTFIRGVLRDGLLPALRLDAVVLRAFLRQLNLLTKPDALTTDPEVQSRVLAIWQSRDQRPAEAPLGPRRREDLLEAVGRAA